MTSLAPLVHAAAPAAPALNTDFYVTAATVIPALFIAIAVLGPAYRNALHSAWLLCQALFADQLSRRRVPFPFSATAATAAIFIAVVVVFRLLAVLVLALAVAFGIATIAAAGYGELLAVYALYQQHDQATTRHVDLIATMFLIILVVTGPMVAYLIRAFLPEAAVQAPAGPQQTAADRHPAAQEPIVTPEAGTGKTDSA